MKIYDIIPKKEINKIIKLGRKYHPEDCRECYFNTLSEITGASCKDITTHLCGKEPSRCREALNIMYNFIHSLIRGFVSFFGIFENFFNS